MGRKLSARWRRRHMETHMRMQHWVRSLARLGPLAFAFATAALPAAAAQQPLRAASPDGRNEVTVELRDGELRYTLRRNAQVVLLPSRLDRKAHV